MSSKKANIPLLMADGLAQLVEQRPFKAWVLGSSPRPVTTKDPHESEGLFYGP